MVADELRYLPGSWLLRLRAEREADQTIESQRYDAHCCRC